MLTFLHNNNFVRVHFQTKKTSLSCFPVNLDEENISTNCLVLSVCVCVCVCVCARIPVFKENFVRQSLTWAVLCKINGYWIEIPYILAHKSSENWSLFGKYFFNSTYTRVINLTLPNQSRWPKSCFTPYSRSNAPLL